MSDDRKISSIFDSLQEEVTQSDLPEEEKSRRLALLQKSNESTVNLLLVGATGSGKSSTINALFDMNAAKVGTGVDPETKTIEKYELRNLNIWDTPGLGDGIDEDREHKEQIAAKLSETDTDENPLIDLVLVILDASSKDLSVSYDVINNTLIPGLGKAESHRILIALNQSDMAMKGRHWDSEQNAPDSVLQDFLTQKANSIKERIFDATGVEVEPICYCAGYMEDDGQQRNPYNLSKLLYHILMGVPAEKRIALADNLNGTASNWANNDDEMDYNQGSSLLSAMEAGADKGAVTGGCILGIPGMLAGAVIGGILGGLHELIVKPLMY